MFTDDTLPKLKLNLANQENENAHASYDKSQNSKKKNKLSGVVGLAKADSLLVDPAFDQSNVMRKIPS